MVDSEFKVNDFVTLRLEKRKTNIYINNKKFIQCKFLLTEISVNETTKFDELKSIDEFSQSFGNPFDIHPSNFLKIPPEVEFWGHCSNLQAWVENNYNTNLLHSNIAFPLLKRLTEVGDTNARKVFKEEIIKRIETGYIPTIIYLITNHYLDFFSKEEFEILLDEIMEQDYNLDERNLDLIYSFDEYLNENEIFFLVIHPKINLFELLIKFGQKLWDKDGNYIGEHRTWAGDLISKVNRNKPKVFEIIVKELIRKDIIKLRKKKVELDGNVSIERVDYSLMDEFSIILFNALYYGQKKNFWLEEFFDN